MSDINTIKKLRNEKDLSINRIAEIMKIDWRTADKYADGAIEKPTIIKKKSGMMYEEKWGEIVGDWLFEDSREKKKHRRNNLQIFRQLQKMDFPGSYRTVCNFIAEWKANHSEETKDKGSERLLHPAGEAQLDFGIMQAVQEGKMLDIYLLILSYPFSNQAFYQPLPSENQECLLEGMKKLFDKSAGVPMAVRIDNMTTAVKKNREKNEEAVLTDEFLRFQLHHGFNTQVCNTASGNEKGHVERRVGYIRYNIFSVPPVITGLDDLSRQLDAFSQEDQDRLHYKKELPIQELWEEEQKHLLKLPKDPFNVRKESSIKANKYNEVVIDNVKVHVPKARNHSRLFSVLTWNHFQILSGNSEVLLEGPRPYMEKRMELPWKMVFLGWREKPRALEHSRYRPYLPSRLAEFLLVPSLELKRARIEFVLSLLPNHSVLEIDANLYELISRLDENEIAHPFEVNWDNYDNLGQSEGVIS